MGKKEIKKQNNLSPTNPLFSFHKKSTSFPLQTAGPPTIDSCLPPCFTSFFNRIADWQFVCPPETRSSNKFPQNANYFQSPNGCYSEPYFAKRLYCILCSYIITNMKKLRVDAPYPETNYQLTVIPTWSAFNIFLL